MKLRHITLPAAAVLMIAVGCSSPEASPESSNTPQVQASDAVSQTPDDNPTPKEDERFVNTTVGDKKFTNGIPVGSVSKNEKGQYAQTTIDPEAKYMKYNPSLATDSLTNALKSKTITGGDIDKAQAKLMRFVTEESLDSELNGGRNVSGWMKQQGDNLHPDFKDSIRKDLESTKDGKWDGGTFLVRDTGEESTYFYSKDHGRLTNRTLDISNIDWAQSGEYNALVFTVQFSESMPSQDQNNTVTNHVSSGTLTYSMIKSGNDWKLGPWKNDFETKELPVD